MEVTNSGGEKYDTAGELNNLYISPYPSALYDSTKHKKDGTKATEESQWAEKGLSLCLKAYTTYCNSLFAFVLA